MTPEEKKAKRAEYMRRWRAANPERAAENARRSMAKWRAEHPDENRDYFQKWKDDHPESIRATQQRQAARQRQLRASDEDWRLTQNAKARGRWEKWKGIPETELQARFQDEHPDAISMDRIRPDFFVPGEGFVEIKRALPYLAYGWRLISQHFPGLYFMHAGRFNGDVDAQFAAEPRPLLVIIFHAITGEVIARKLLT